MKQINYNAKTGETIIEEMPDVEVPVTEEIPVKSIEQRVSDLETLTLQNMGVI